MHTLHTGSAGLNISRTDKKVKIDLQFYTPYRGGLKVLPLCVLPAAGMGLRSLRPVQAAGSRQPVIDARKNSSSRKKKAPLSGGVLPERM